MDRGDGGVGCWCCAATATGRVAGLGPGRSGRSVVAARRLDHLFVALDGVERTQAVSLHAQSARVMIIMENSATEMIFTPRWYTVAQVAQLLNYGESKVRMLIITGQLRSIKDGRSRRILPEWVEAYVQDRAKATEDIW